MCFSRKKRSSQLLWLLILSTYKRIYKWSIVFEARNIVVCCDCIVVCVQIHWCEGINVHWKWNHFYDNMSLNLTALALPYIFNASLPYCVFIKHLNCFTKDCLTKNVWVLNRLHGLFLHFWLKLKDISNYLIFLQRNNNDFLSISKVVIYCF